MMQGTLIAFAALSEQQQLGMLRSAGLLSPIAYLDKLSSPLARAAADVFLGEVRVRLDRWSWRWLRCMGSNNTIHID